MAWLTPSSVVPAPPTGCLPQAPSLTTGGLAWFGDLTLPDPYYGLPLLCAATTLAMIEYGMNVTGDQMATPDRAGERRLQCGWGRWGVGGRGGWGR